LDPRCTQIAAFNVALCAWKLAGYRPLPALNLACSGLGINAPVAAWTGLGAGNALAEGAMKQLYELFRQAPTLGSLIDPTRVGGELFVAHFDKIRDLLSAALASEKSEDAELAVVAQGIARAAAILAERYTLIATNVPYLKRGKQTEALQEHCEHFHDDAKGNLACAFVDRCLRIAAPGGTIAVVSINEMLFLGTYKHLRKRLLRDYEWAFAARLGAGAFETISGEVVNVSLLGITAQKPHEHRFLGLDMSQDDSPGKKAAALVSREARLFEQDAQLKNPDARIVVGSLEQSAKLLSVFATPGKGSTTGDSPHYHRCFWELPGLSSEMTPWLDSPLEGDLWSGRYLVSLVGVDDPGLLAENGCMIRGQALWGTAGVAVSKMSGLRAFLYAGEVFDDNVGVLCPQDPELIPAILAYCTSEEYSADIRAIDQALKVTAATLAKVPFDVERWREVAREQFPDGLPPTASNNPTQWLFTGHPRGASSPLHAAVARLIGYRWPRQTGSAFPNAPAISGDELQGLADDDGIVCMTALRGEPPAADRIRALLAKAYGASWSSELLTELLGGVGATSLEDWLRNSFFSQHCELFEQRPFVWHVWDGLASGFAALVNYHQLAAPEGEGRRTLEKLIYTYLGDWIDRQRADQKSGVEGADARVAAAEHLKQELERILEGEPPYDIFVRWKPLHEQPVGWDPDVNDGVRINTRPFMTAKPLNARGRNACILRVMPKIKWEKDRGAEPIRAKTDFPWFYGWDKQAADFLGGAAWDGNRWNDLHYSRAVKLAARERAKGDKS
ncbi:MAG: SAM-dependent methyltransferase, partial [Polyangiaceae bacterium]|nr:SAM-dependent methyltransferase [Polyangiaceae bacterium]